MKICFVSMLAGMATALAALPAYADPPADTGIALEMRQAEQLAIEHQPLLDSLDAQARAARQNAIAERQLPDPQLLAGVSGLPINTEDAGSFTRESDTQIQVGLMQEFPRASKRRLRGEVMDREAQRVDAGHELTRRSVRRDAALAWAEVWRFEQALSLARATQREVDIQVQAVEIALKSGKATQADLLTSRVEAGRMRDTVAGTEQSVAHARNLLSRWIGDAAFAPVSSDLPNLAEPPSLDVLLQRIRSHPNLAVLQVQVAAAQTGADLAQASYAPDWRLQLGYGHRQAYSEEVTLLVGVDLPVFTRNRQDRALAASLAQKEAAEFSAADTLRQLESEARLNHHDWFRLSERLQGYDRDLLPQTQSRIEAAHSSWRAGQGTLAQVLDARRAALELQTNRLDLQVDALKHSIQLEYLGAYDAPLQAAENRHE